MAEQTEGRGDTTSREEKAHIFPAVFLGGPQEELEALAERKRRMYESLGESENAARLAEALDLARDRLAAALKAPRAKIGS